MKDSPHRLRLHCNSAIPERYRDSMRNLLAFDLGASNGRAILGRFDGTRVTLQELHRFENNYIEMNGVFYWDLPYLYQQLKLGFLAFRQANMGELDCFGIDAWGVDYGLLDKNGNLLSNPRAYRYAREEDMAEVWKQLDFADIFARTGIAAMNFNTIFQLMRRRCEDDAALQNAETLLLMPDLLWLAAKRSSRTAVERHRHGTQDDLHQSQGHRSRGGWKVRPEGRGCPENQIQLPNTPSDSSSRNHPAGGEREAGDVPETLQKKLLPGLPRLYLR